MALGAEYAAAYYIAILYMLTTLRAKTMGAMQVQPMPNYRIRTAIVGLRLRGRYQCLDCALKCLSAFVSVNLASGFYEPLALRFRYFLIRRLSCFFLSSASFGLSSHPISPLTSCLIGETLANNAVHGAFGALKIIHA